MESSSWEKHTKGIGSKLLQKYGFKGRLGANEDGRSTVIDVTVRPARVGLGFGDSSNNSEVNIAPKIESGPPRVNNGWKKLKRERPQDGMELLLNEELGVNNYVIDMRPPTAESSDIKTRLFGSELLHNFDLLERRYSQSLKSATAVVHRYSNKEDAHRIIEAQRQHDIDQERCIVLAKMLVLLEEVDVLIRATEVQSANVFGLIEQCYNLNPSLFKSISGHSLLSIIANAFGDRLKCSEADLGRNLPHWIAQLQDFRAVFLSWGESWGSRGEDEWTSEINFVVQQVCDRLLLMNFRAIMKIVIQSESDSILPNLVGEIKSMVSETVWQQVVQQEIIPVLQHSIESGTIVSIGQGYLNKIVIPWVEVLHEAARPLFPPIRKRLARWFSYHSSVIDDSSIRHEPGDAEWVVVGVQLLLPWSSIFDELTMLSFIERSVLPSLSSALKHAAFLCDITSASQAASVVQAVLQWQLLLSVEQLGCLFVASFLPSWLMKLRDNLTEKSCDYSGIAKWYEFWRRLLEPLRDHDLVLESFHLGLLVIETHVHAGSHPNDSVGSFLRAVGHREFFQLYQSRKKLNRGERFLGQHNIKPSAHAGSLKDIVSTFAERHGVSFAPHRMDVEGHQLWRLGNGFIYFQDGVIFWRAGQEGIWKPITLDNLFALCGDS